MRQGPSPCLFWERWPVGGSTGIWIWKWVSHAIANRNMMILSQCNLMNTIFSFADLGPLSCNGSCKLMSYLHLYFWRICFSFPFAEMNWKFKVLCYAYILPIEYVLQSNLHWSNFLEIGYSFDSPQCALLTIMPFNA